VKVEANSIGIATETSELSQTFSHEELDKLPNIDRNPLYQMNLIPGANNDVGSGNYGSNGGENGSAIGQTRPQLASIGGVDANANTIYIEGVPNREPQNAYISITPPIEGVQEVQVYTGKYNAEFGFSGSAVVNIVTKSGATTGMARPLIFCAMKRRTRPTTSRPACPPRPSGGTSLAEL